MEDPKRPTHEELVDDWKRNAEKNDDRNYEFLRSLKYRDYGFEPDDVAGELHEQAFQSLDCTRCANCCKTLNITFNDDDIARVSQHLGISSDDLVSEHLEEVDGSLQTRDKPCPFLGDDDHCTIYEIRPTVCREYPYTNKDGLVFRTIGIANSALTCPAVFNVVENMRRRV